MVYKVIGLMSGSSLDGLDIVYTELHQNGGNWTFEIVEGDCFEYGTEWVEKLKSATTLNALDYQLLHADYGHYTGKLVNDFIEKYGLQYKPGLIASHGHTTFHVPAKRMTAQLGDGAAIAAETGLPVVSDLRALDVAFGGQGAPIVPIGEKLLFKEYDLFLNIGGIANISFNNSDGYIAFDVCPANRVLNMLANKVGKEYDESGAMAAKGNIHDELLQKLNAFEYYKLSHPKSLANNFGTDEIFPMVASYNLPVEDALRTYTEHICLQVANSVSALKKGVDEKKLLVTGGGAFNTFLIDTLSQKLKQYNVVVVVPDEKIVKFKEALVMALIGVLRWREENNVLSTVTGASRDSIGGAVWIGQEA